MGEGPGDAIPELIVDTPLSSSYGHGWCEHVLYLQQPLFLEGGGGTLSGGYDMLKLSLTCLM